MFRHQGRFPTDTFKFNKTTITTMSEPFLGQIQMFGFNFPPRGWAQCNGQILPINQNTALFSLMGTQYGGDGRTTFGLPELRNRSAVHVGNGPGLGNAPIGQKSGATTHTMSQANMANHSHTVTPRANTGDGEETNPTDGFHAKTGDDIFAETANANMAPLTSSAVGGSQAFSIRDPYQVVNFCIALQGIFPSRS